MKQRFLFWVFLYALFLPRPSSPMKFLQAFRIGNDDILVSMRNNQLGAFEALLAQGLNPNTVVQGKFLLEHAVTDPHDPENLVALLFMYGAKTQFRCSTNTLFRDFLKDYCYRIFPAGFNRMLTLLDYYNDSDVVYGSTASCIHVPYATLLALNMQATLQALPLLPQPRALLSLPKCLYTTPKKIIDCRMTALLKYWCEKMSHPQAVHVLALIPVVYDLCINQYRDGHRFYENGQWLIKYHCNCNSCYSDAPLATIKIQDIPKQEETEDTDSDSSTDDDDSEDDRIC